MVVLKGKSSELMQGWELHVKVGGCEDDAFHLKELGKVVKSITEVDIFFSLKGMDLIVF